MRGIAITLSPTLIGVLSLLITPLFGHPTRREDPLDALNATRWIRQGPVGLGPRQEHAVATINSIIYVVGGVIHDDTYSLITTARVENFDTNYDRWSVPAPLPQPISHVNLAAVEGRLYSFGGLAGQSPQDPDWVSVGECNRYDAGTDTWSPVAPKLGKARGASAIGVHESIVYVAGGMSRLSATEGGTQDAPTDVSSYDTITDTWNEGYPPLPELRQHAGRAVVNGVLYVIGGREDVEQHYDTVFALNMDQSDSWTHKTPMPYPAVGLRAQQSKIVSSYVPEEKGIYRVPWVCSGPQRCMTLSWTTGDSCRRWKSHVTALQLRVLATGCTFPEAARHRVEEEILEVFLTTCGLETFEILSIVSIVVNTGSRTFASTMAPGPRITEAVSG
jgi:N-acetylneuraminic acid mutarotase